jgi:hypothetical protein
MPPQTPLKVGDRMGATGLEPVTPSVSNQGRSFRSGCSPTNRDSVHNPNCRRARKLWRKTPWGKHSNRRTARKNHQANRLKCLIAYGGNPPKCACCGESIFQFLTLDHANNDGSSHREALTGYRRAATQSFFRALIKKGFPNNPPLIVLCYNCNLGRERNGGICPHTGHRQSVEYKMTSKKREWSESAEPNNGPVPDTQLPLPFGEEDPC